MKAVVFTRYGSPDGLELTEVPIPEPGDDEVLVRVGASSINSWDWEFLHGEPFIIRFFYGFLKPRPGRRILGSDIAGTVEAVGKAARRFQPGDEVFGDLWDNWGGFAEYALARETDLEAKPRRSTFAQAASVPQAGVLALQGLLRGGPVKPGQKVLINGAGGGVGTFALQIARLWGAEVTGVDASHKLDVVRSLGADHAIDFEQVDFTRTGQRYDLVVDCQNFRSIFDHKRALNPGGTYAMIGGSIPRVFQIWLLGAIGRLMRDDKKFCLVAEGPNKGLKDLGELIEDGKLEPVIDSSYPLDEVPRALRYFGEGKHKGKIVIVM